VSSSQASMHNSYAQRNSTGICIVLENLCGSSERYLGSQIHIYLDLKPQGISVQGIYLCDNRILKLHFLGLREINF
jgi:hypothetical protein